MGGLTFRKLNADEVDARVSTVSDKGLQLLLYKDARVDMTILDETVGPENWQRNHEVINGNLFCNVGIRIVREDGTADWIWKQDVGVESYTEKEKGQASDSFKRSCTNFGIGRELYTAPFIWVKAEDTSIVPKGDKFTCYDTFTVQEIGYDSNGNINLLKIYGAKKKKVVFTMYPKGEAKKEEPKKSGPKKEEDKTEAEMMDAGNEFIDKPKVNTILKELARTGIGLKGVLSAYGIENLNQMKVADYKGCIDALKKKPDKVA